VLCYSNMEVGDGARIEDIWPVLRRAGVPVGAVRARGSAHEPELRHAIRVVTANPGVLPATERVALLAWLAAFRHHWPRRFEEALGKDGATLLALLRVAPFDPNQYLKLRRIAVENLAQP